MLALVAVTAASKAVASDVVQQELDAALRAPPDLMHGEALFNDTCVTCHGPDGGGQSNGTVPAIAAQHPRFIIRQVVDFRHGRRSDLRMEHSTGRHRLVNAQDIADVAAYVSALPPVKVEDVGSGDHLAEAQSMYGRACATCHGDSAVGDAAAAVPRLAGQHFGYLLRQMRDTADDRGGQRPAFPREHGMLLQRFEDADLVDLADYLSRLGQGESLGTGTAPAAPISDGRQR
ncbi:MAG TPA: c-type cytochrome [Steroidobacteraceae bacterium]|nr:c-type cytochrome [Steroidobacteraceae bacterium]